MRFYHYTTHASSNVIQKQNTTGMEGLNPKDRETREMVHLRSCKKTSPKGKKRETEENLFTLVPPGELRVQCLSLFPSPLVLVAAVLPPLPHPPQQRASTAAATGLCRHRHTNKAQASNNLF